MQPNPASDERGDRYSQPASHTCTRTGHTAWQCGFQRQGESRGIRYQRFNLMVLAQSTCTLNQWQSTAAAAIRYSQGESDNPVRGECFKWKGKEYLFNDTSAHFKYTRYFGVSTYGGFDSCVSN